ncbi:MAG: hypothetical protein MUO72_03830 [Bacteroidales bacterium]|nr:hypothetical protein [Bacteroidales bacterium]
MKEDEFSNNTDIKRIEVLDLYLLINECLDLSETEIIHDQAPQKIFFSTFKIVHTSFNEGDLQVSMTLFLEYYQRISNDPEAQALKDSIKNVLGVEYIEIVNFLKSIQGSFARTKSFEFLDKLIVINYENIDYAWENRNPKIPLPSDFCFLEKFPFIKKGSTYYSYDVFQLFHSIITRIYNVLFNQTDLNFKDYFGKKIIEPILINRLTKNLTSKKINLLKVQTKNYEYADFGLKNEKDIFLFEIKSIYFSPEIRFTQNLDFFLKSFDGKYVKNGGIEQQIKHIQDIDKNMSKFLRLNNLPREKYKFHLILIGFDEGLQSVGCNLYLNSYYKKRYLEIHPFLTNLDLSSDYGVVTINELEILFGKFESPDKKLDTLKKYILSTQKIYPFREFVSTD